jgi:hypothetical protein
MNSLQILSIVEKLGREEKTGTSGKTPYDIF